MECGESRYGRGQSGREPLEHRQQLGIDSLASACACEARRFWPYAAYERGERLAFVGRSGNLQQSSDHGRLERRIDLRADLRRGPVAIKQCAQGEARHLVWRPHHEASDSTKPAGSARRDGERARIAFALVFGALKDHLKDQAVRITLVRHGESMANRVQRWQGQGDSPLSVLGREQAGHVGRRLSPVRFDRVIASDLSRARDTALAIGHAFETDPAWREFDVGAWEGLTREEVNERYPVEMERLKAGEDIPMGGGESYRTFSERIDRALARLRTELSPGDHALIVCHGGVIGTLMAGQLGLRGKSRWPLGRASNTSVSQIVIDGEHAELCIYNDASHLWPSATWPHREADAACVALVADVEPHTVQGEFAARYDARANLPSRHTAFSRLAQHAESPRDTTARITEALSELRTKHVGERIAVALEGELIRAFVETTLWLDGTRQGALRGPPLGSISHVTVTDGGPALLDYGALTNDTP